MTLEANFFTDLKDIIKMNILQYQGGVKLFNREKNQMVTVDPVLLRKANLAFKVSDGLSPSEKLIDGESLAMGFQTIASSQALASGYNLTPMFSYLMKTRGAQLQPFEKSPEQLAYEQALGAWQQAAQMIMVAAEKANPPMTPEQIQEMIKQNPQPKPEEFGYTPGKVAMSPFNPLNPESQSIMSTMQQKVNQASQQQPPQATSGTQGVTE